MGSVIVLCFVVHFSFTIISIGRREMDALLFFSSCCLMIVAWLFLMVSDMGVSVGVIVFFSDHTHLLFNLWMKQHMFRSRKKCSALNC